MSVRFICAVGCLLVAGAICDARQAAAPAILAPQTSALVTAVSSPEMEALAGKLAEKLGKGKANAVVVAGGAISETKVNEAGRKEPVMKVSELGVSLRDGLNDALARNAKNVRVIGTAELRALLKQNRVSACLPSIPCEWLRSPPPPLMVRRRFDADMSRHHHDFGSDNHRSPG